MSFMAYGGDPTGMSGFMHYGNAGLGWPGDQVPASGITFASLLYNDVIANGWQAREVRWRLTNRGTLPLLQVDEDGSFYHPTMPDGTYQAYGIVSVDGEDVGPSTLTVTWGTVLGTTRRIVRMTPLKRKVSSMARRPEILEDLDVAEVDTVQFSYADELRAGEVITDATVTSSRYVGADPTPQDLLSAARQVVSPDVFQPISGAGAVPDTVYALRSEATTNQGRKLTAAAYMRCISLGAA